MSLYLTKKKVLVTCSFLVVPKYSYKEYKAWIVEVKVQQREILDSLIQRCNHVCMVLTFTSDRVVKMPSDVKDNSCKNIYSIEPRSLSSCRERDSMP